MTKEQKALLNLMQVSASQAKVLKALRKEKGWEVLEKILRQVQHEALQDVLSSGGQNNESVFIRIGHAQAVNVIFNFMTHVVKEGRVAEEDRANFIKQIRESEQADLEQDDVVRYSGHGAV